MNHPGLFDVVLDLLFPWFCPACGTSKRHHREVLCIRCQHQLPRTGHFSADQAGHSVVSEKAMGMEKPLSLLYFRKGGITQSILHEIKYKGNRKLGFFMGQLIGRELEVHNSFDPASVLIPVPIHPRKRKIRGYNQSEIIAQGISSVTGSEVITNVLVRLDQAESQTTKSRAERFENLENSFGIKASVKSLTGPVLLVDDVFTTGATAESCVAVLGSAFKQSTIRVITLAVALNR